MTNSTLKLGRAFTPRKQFLCGRKRPPFLTSPLTIPLSIHSLSLWRMWECVSVFVCESACTRERERKGERVRGENLKSIDFFLVHNRREWVWGQRPRWRHNTTFARSVHSPIKILMTSDSVCRCFIDRRLTVNDQNALTHWLLKSCWYFDEHLDPTLLPNTCFPIS